jgi:hypothetical protein
VKALISRRRAAMGSDYHWTEEGEPLGQLTELCDNPYKRYVDCRCGLGFVGLASRHVTSVAVVEPRNESSLAAAAESCALTEHFRDESGGELDLTAELLAWFRAVDRVLEDVPIGGVIRVRHDYTGTGVLISMLLRPGEHYSPRLVCPELETQEENA